MPAKKTKQKAQKNKLKEFVSKRWKFLIFVVCFVLIGSYFAFKAFAAEPEYALLSTRKPAVIDSGNARATELGMRFTANTNGKVKGVKFYKSSRNTGTHTGTLWSNSGQKLATVTFKNESATGWQKAMFATPVNITANTKYVISYHTNKGYFSYTRDFFAASNVVKGPLTGLKNTNSEANGIYSHSATSVFPTTSGTRATNYFVDVVFSPTVVPPTCPSGQTGTPPNCVTPPSDYPTAATTGVPAGTTLTPSSRTRFETPGEVVSGLSLGCIEIVASNVTIRNSKITCTNSQTGTTPGIGAKHWSNAFSGLKIENVTIEGVNYRAIELNPNSTVKKVKIIGQGRGIALAHGAKVEDSYISLDNSNSNCSNAFGEGHATAMAFFSAYDVTIINNHIEMKAERYPADACISGVIAVYPENVHGGPSYNVVFDHNRIALPRNDSHYYISLSYTPAAPYNESPNNRIQVINNRFEGRSSKGGLFWNSYPQTGDVLNNNQWCPNPYGSANASVGCSTMTP